MNKNYLSSIKNQNCYILLSADSTLFIDIVIKYEVGKLSIVILSHDWNTTISLKVQKMQSKFMDFNFSNDAGSRRYP